MRRNASPAAASRAGLRIPLAAALIAVLSNASAAGGDVINLGTSVPSAEEIQKGLFPDDECEQLKSNGFKCMGFKPPVRFALPSASFKIGSAELPEAVMRQLDAFAAVLRNKSGSARAVRIEGHADASGDPARNEILSLRRAEAARDYLVSKQVSPDLLKAVGMGSAVPVDPAQPLAPRNRRVVIGRDQAPAAPSNP